MKTEFRCDGGIVFLPENEFEAFAIFNWFEANTKYDTEDDSVWYIKSGRIGVSLEEMRKDGK